MQYIADSKEMKSIDEETIAKVGIPALVLMEKAAMAVSNKIQEKISKSDSILVVCGTGNNGGDGVAVARILKHHGYHVEILILGDEKRGSDSFRQQLGIARNLEVLVINNAKISEYNVIIDAIFGIGLSKPVNGIFESVIREINNSEALVYSVDVPSGVNASTGKIANVAVRANVTITFGVLKIGLILYPGCEYAGEVVVADIGFPQSVIEEKLLHGKQKAAFIYEKQDLNLLPIRKKYSNKGTFGKVLVIAGTKNMCGAAYFSAKAAYRAGAGLVKIMTVEENRCIIQQLLPEAILSTYNPANLKNKIEIDRLLSELDWATSVVIGPGMGNSSSADFILDLVLQNVKASIIIDADAIHLLANKENYVRKTKEEVLLDFPQNVILTPHLKEMATLIDCSVNEIQEKLILTAKMATREKQFVLALKDARTIVATGTKLYINTSGNEGMATGGSGDVLTGIIASLVAQGMNPYDATCLGVYVHGLAGDVAKEKKGSYGLMAGDIIEMLPYVLK